MKAQQLETLRAMGVDVWVSRQLDTADTESHPQSATVESPPGSETETEIRTSGAGADQVPNDGSATDLLSVLPDVSALDWEPLRHCVADCHACELHRERSQTVFGTGNREASWLLVGEAPGADEDQQGEPFVGRAGQLLNAMLESIGLVREAVYIANIVKCRPPNNRNPRHQEAQACQAYLQRQIELLQPDLILAMGKVAASNLLETEQAVGKMRGKLHRYGQQQIPLVVTYHPAYLLRTPADKVKVWQDLQFACGLEKSH